MIRFFPFVFGWSGIAGAATLTVDPSDSSAYQTIQGAIDVAADGDEIQVVTGLYLECLNFSGLDLTLTGMGLENDTIVDAEGDCDATVTAELSETVTISSITFTNTDQRILYAVDATLVLDSVVLDAGGEELLDGGGVYMDGGSLEMLDGEITRSIGGEGGAIYLAQDGVLILNGTSVRDTEAHQGAGI